jgi:hypothetical protein
MRIVNLHHTAFVQTFRKLGHDVLSIGTTPECDVALSEPLSHMRFLELLSGFNMRPDLIFWCDACQTPWIFGIESMPAVTIGFSVDQYMNPWHVPYSAAFDAFLVAQKDYLPLFIDSPTKRPARWMPLFCSPDRDKELGLSRDIPVSFVGTVNGSANPHRHVFLTAFRNLAPLFVASGDYVPIYGRSKIVLNQSAAGELNFRLFEAMACGATVLTEDTQNGLTDLFTPGEDLLTYRRGDADHAAQVALAALDNPHLPAIAASGRRHVLAQHTVTGRAREVLTLAQELLSSGAPKGRLEQQDKVRDEVKKAYAFLATDDRLPICDPDRQFFLTMSRT